MTEIESHAGNPKAGRWIGWLTPARFAALLGLILLAAFAEVVLGMGSFVFRDFGHFGYPLATYHREAFWRGEMPLWNPFSQCGLPFLAQWNTMVFYPGSLFYLLLPLPWALSVFGLLHLFWAGLGMYCLTWSWTRHRLAAGVGGLAFAFSGLLQHSLMWPNNVAALGWMPWVVLLVPQGWQRGGRCLIGAIVVGAMQMLTGAPEVILLTWGIVGVLMVLDLVRPRVSAPGFIKRMLICVIAVALLGAAQLLPFLELLADSQRDTHFYESVWPMPITGWANLLVPLFHCQASVQGVFFQSGQYWTSSYYAGAATLALALFAVMATKEWRIRGVALLALLGLLLALGDAGVVYAALKRVVPQLGFIRFPIKFVVLTVFTLPLLAACGVSALLPADAAERSGARKLLLVAGVLTVILALLLAYARQCPALEESWPVTARNGLMRGVFLWATVGLLLILAKSAGGRLLPLAAVAVLLALAADALSHAPNLAPTARKAVFDPLPPSLTPPARLGKSRALVSNWEHRRFNRNFDEDFERDFLVKRAGLFANCNLLDGVPKVDGLYSLSLREADAISGLLYSRTNDTRLAEVFHPTNRPAFDGLLDFLAVSCVSAPQQPSQWLTRTNYLPPSQWLTRTNYLPLVTAGQEPAFASPAATLRRLVTPGFNPRREVLLPLTSREWCEAARAGSVRILSTQFGPHRIRIELQAEAAGLVVLSQSHFRPWRARVDGADAEIHPANLAFQAVLVPAGGRVLELTYEDGRFRVGLLASVATLLMVIGWRSVAGREA
jgi:hypothetical protein